MNRDSQDRRLQRSSTWTSPVVAIASIAILAGGVAALVTEEAEFRWFVLFAGTFLLAPSALLLSVRAWRQDRRSEEARAVLRIARENLEKDRVDLSRREKQLEIRAARVEDQWQTLRRLVEERGAGRVSSRQAPDTGKEAARKVAPGIAAVTGDVASSRELAALRQELTSRRTAERILSERIEDLEAARVDAEAKLRQVLEAARTRGAEGTGTPASPGLSADAGDGETGTAPDAAEQAGPDTSEEERLAAERRAEEERVAKEERQAAERRAAALLAEAEETAHRLVAEAEERARALKAQGEAEIEAADRELREKEEVERTIAERIAELEAAREAAEQRLRRVQEGTRAPRDQG